MFKKIILLIILPLVFAVNALAQEVVSAVRPIRESWKVTAARYEFNRKFNFKIFSVGQTTAYDSRTDKINLKKLPEFGKNDAEYFQMFNDIRDRRFLKDPDVENFHRRISWLYPYDGCFARAEHVAHLINKIDPKAQFGRVFIFGDLEVQTPNSTTGSVGWWYHVAVIFKSQGKAFVIDPSLNYYKPLELSVWVKMMVPEETDAELALCSAWTYTPSSDCMEKEPMSEGSAASGISRYLSAERDNLIELGRNPEAELGHSPPWL